MSTKYNGWKNYNTWLVNVWDVLAFFDGKLDVETARQEVEYSLECSGLDLDSASLLVDIVNGVLSGIDWHELADSHNAELEDCSE